MQKNQEQLLSPDQAKQSKIKLEPLDLVQRSSDKEQSKTIDESDKLIRNKEIKDNQIELVTTTRDESTKKLSNGKKKSLSKRRLRVKYIMTSKPVQWTMIFLIIFYSLLIFTNLAIDDIVDDEDLSSKIIDKLSIVELIILVIFSIEIIASSYGQGFGKYFKDTWLLFDAIVIIASIVLVIVDLSVNLNKQFKTISSVIRCIFRFLRIFLLIRKAHSLKKIKTTSKMRTPAEKILDILQEIKDMFESTDIITDIEWVIEKIGSGNIYQPIMFEGQAHADVTNWIEYGVAQKQPNQDNQNSQQQKVSLAVQQSLKISPEDQIILKSIPLQALKMFDQEIDELSFNCFNLQKILKGQEITCGILYLYQRHQLFTQLKIDLNKFKLLTKCIQDGYKQNPYHNSLHAFDVMQTLNWLIAKGKFIELSNLSNLDLAACYFAAIIHDFEHPGLNNDFMKNTQDDIAILYNDVAVLENYHISETFTLMLQDDERYNITENFTENDFKRFRNVIISAVLNTDMSRHFTELSKVKARLTQADFDIKDKDKLMCIETIFHACDISNPIKYWDCCFQWTKNVLEEMWKQGDLEREYNMPITYLADRYTVNMAKSQGGFIDFVVQPTFEVVANIVPEIQPYLKNFADNKEKWKGLIPKYDQDLILLKEEQEKKRSQKLNADQ